MSFPQNNIVRQVKFFIANNLAILESDVNRFLMTKPENHVCYIQFNIVGEKFTTIVIYVKKRKEK